MDTGMRVFVSSSSAPKPRMIVFGAIDFAAAVARQGAFLGFHVTVCDAARFSPLARGSRTPTRWSCRGRDQYLRKQIEEGSIDERTVICVLTHDPKFDVPVLDLALRSTARRPAYIGAMGSRKTHEDRLVRLREAGLDDEQLSRLTQPDRTGPRRAHPGGNRRLGRRRDHRAALGRDSRSAQRDRSSRSSGNRGLARRRRDDAPVTPLALYREQHSVVYTEKTQ